MVLQNSIRELRFAHGQLTQAALAKAVGVSRQTIISIEKNRYTPSVLLALKISQFFGVPLETCFYINQSSSGIVL
ncbi:XRE family transcriptional regulator [bacterium SM23_57]|nr:MAG: XRE family transcriptional regulator [bacterium SM23_57]